MNYRQFRKRLGRLEIKLQLDLDPGADALVRMILADSELRKANLKWFAAEARKEPQASQLKEEFARLIYLKQQGGTDQHGK